MVKYLCDRCGKDVGSEDDLISIDNLDVDVCADCFDQIQAFAKNKGLLAVDEGMLSLVVEANEYLCLEGNDKKQLCRACPAHNKMHCPKMLAELKKSWVTLKED